MAKDPTWLELAAIAYPPEARTPLPPSAFCKSQLRAAKAIGVHVTTLRDWLNRGCPGMVGYDVRAVAEWVAENCGAERLSELPDDAPKFVEGKSELAALFGIHRASVSKWEAKGCPKRGGYDVNAIRLWAVENASLEVIDTKHRRSCQAISDAATAILKRGPLMSDIDADFVGLVLRRLAKTDDRIGRRIKRMQAICKTATTRFKHPSVDFTEIAVCRRQVRLQQLDSPPPEKFDDIPEEYQSDKLKMPLSVLLQQYKRERLINCSPNTVRLMEASILSFSRFIGRHAVLGDLRQGNVLDYLHDSLDSGRYAAASVQSIRERLLALWRFAARKRWLPDFPEIPQVKCPERIPDAWSRDDMEKLLGAAGKLVGPVGLTDVSKSLFFKTMILVTYDTAERIGAVRQIKFTDIKDGWLTVKAETRKGKTRDKRFKLRPETLEHIAKIRSLTGGRQKLVFDWPYSNTYIYRDFSRLLKAAGLPDTRRNKWHKIRRTSASEFEAAGGNASVLLDHASRSTTMKYLDPSVLKQQQPADLVPGIGKKPEEPKQPAGDDLLEQIRKLVGSKESKAS